MSGNNSPVPIPLSSTHGKSLSHCLKGRKGLVLLMTNVARPVSKRHIPSMAKLQKELDLDTD